MTGFDAGRRMTSGLSDRLSEITSGTHFKVFGDFQLIWAARKRNKKRVISIGME